MFFLYLTALVFFNVLTTVEELPLSLTGDSTHSFSEQLFIGETALGGNFTGETALGNFNGESTALGNFNGESMEIPVRYRK